MKNPYFDPIREYAEELESGEFQLDAGFGFAIRSTIPTSDLNARVGARVGNIGARGAFHVAACGGDMSRLRTLASMADRAATFAGHVERCREEWLDDRRDK